MISQLQREIFWHFNLNGKYNWFSQMARRTSSVFLCILFTCLCMMPFVITEETMMATEAIESDEAAATPTDHHADEKRIKAGLKASELAAKEAQNEKDEQAAIEAAKEKELAAKEVAKRAVRTSCVKKFNEDKAKGYLMPGMVVTLNTPDEKFCGVHQGKQACDKSSVGYWERFKIVNAHNGLFAMRSWNGGKGLQSTPDEVPSKARLVGGYPERIVAYKEVKDGALAEAAAKAAEEESRLANVADDDTDEMTRLGKIAKELRSNATKHVAIAKTAAEFLAGPAKHITLQVNDTGKYCSNTTWCDADEAFRFQFACISSCSEATAYCVEETKELLAELARKHKIIDDERNAKESGVKAVAKEKSTKAKAAANEEDGQRKDEKWEKEKQRKHIALLKEKHDKHQAILKEKSAKKEKIAKVHMKEVANKTAVKEKSDKAIMLENKEKSSPANVFSEPKNSTNQTTKVFSKEAHTSKDYLVKEKSAKASMAEVKVKSSPASVFSTSANSTNQTTTVFSKILG